MIGGCDRLLTEWSFRVPDWLYYQGSRALASEIHLAAIVLGIPTLDNQRSRLANVKHLGQEPDRDKLARSRS